MITKTETLYGCRVTENPIPTINANPSIVLTGNGKRFGISRDQLSTHCLLLGSTGTGKTNAILHFVKQLKASMKSDDVMLVFDSKLDFVKFITQTITSFLIRETALQSVLIGTYLWTLLQMAGTKKRLF